MLYNVFYKEEYFPNLSHIDYIINETTDEIYHTVQEFLVAFENCPDEINHIKMLKVFYPFLEAALLESGYTSKHTQTAHFAPYTPKLKLKTFVADISAKDTADAMREISVVRMGCPAGQKYLICYEPFTLSHIAINYRYDKEEVHFQQYLNKIQCRNSTPAGAMKRDVSPSGNLFEIKASTVSNEIMWMLKCAKRNPSIIEAYELGYHEKGWSYDINSMYLSQLNQLEYLPNLPLARKVKEITVLPPHHHGVRWIGINRSVVCLPGETIGPGDWIIPPSPKKNPFKDIIAKLWADKQEFKLEGGPQYRFYKMKSNSFIGMFGRQTRRRRHFKDWDDTDGRKDREPTTEMFYRWDIFCIVTTMARRRITECMDMARAGGCNILQVNTDGFLTDKPIPNFENDNHLGGLRLDKELTNLIIFSPNQYAADGVPCISGLPKDLYVHGQTDYTYERVEYNRLDRCFRIVEVKIDLLKAIKEQELTLEDLYEER